MTPPHPHHPSHGYTLVELLIALALTGILAALSYPSFARHLATGYRADARRTLLEAALAMQRHHALHLSFTTADGLAPSLPAALRQSPSQGRAIYIIQVDQVSPSSYRLVARPVTPGPMADDACGQLTLDEVQRQGHTGSAPAESCWR